MKNVDRWFILIGLLYGDFRLCLRHLDGDHASVQRTLICTRT